MCTCICISAQFSWNTSMYLIHWLQFCISPVLWKLTTYISEGTGNIFSAMHAGNAPESLDLQSESVTGPDGVWLPSAKTFPSSETAPHPNDIRAKSYISAARNLTSITWWRVVLTQFSWECAFHLQFVVFFYSSKLVVRRCSLTFERSNSLAKTSVKKGDDKFMIFILDGLSAGVN